MENNEAARVKAYLGERKAIVDAALDRYLPKADTYPPVIFESVRYSIFAGGKRLRPIFCVAAAETVGGDMAVVLPTACALEMIHTYSLIHDDLPAMDDDEYRRGRLTNHKVYGEGLAVLAGDALLTDAFRLLSGKEAAESIAPEKVVTVIHEIAEAVGFFGMVGGQVADLDAEGKDVDFETLNYIHHHKTEALITVSLRAGAILANASDHDLEALTVYGGKIGLAFQIADDILDIEGDLASLGKETGCDSIRKKATYPSLVGLEQARSEACRLVEDAVDALNSFDHKADPLRMIARFIVDRRS